MNLAGRNALITGGASGIGAAVAESWAKAGASVTIVDVNAEALNATARRLDVNAEEKAGVLAEALPWLQRFRGSTVVVKFGGNAMVDAALLDAFAEDIVFMRLAGLRPVVVHGGGPQPAPRDPLDEFLLLLDRHLGRGEHGLGRRRPGQDLGDEGLQFADHVGPAAGHRGRLEDRLGIDAGDPRGGGIEAGRNGSGLGHAGIEKGAGGDRAS